MSALPGWSLPIAGSTKQSSLRMVWTPASGTKRFGLGQGRFFELNFQVFNALNASGITSINRLTGPQFGLATGIVSARVARFGGGITF